MSKNDGWLYGFRNLAWMEDNELRTQLPYVFRLMAALFRVQRKLSQPYVRLGSQQFKLAAVLNDLIRTGPIRFEVDGVIAYLASTDPRMLAVPGELRNLLSGQSLIAKILKPNDTFVDVGANHGAFSNAASKRVGREGLVVAFEPQRRFAALVEKALAENAFSPYRVFVAGCGSRNERLTFFIPDGSSSGRASLHECYVDQECADRVEIDVVTLDSALQDIELRGHLFIKIDVEGAEYDVLQGARKTIARHRPTLMLEINHDSMQAANTTLEDYQELLGELGYARFRKLSDLSVTFPLSDLFISPKTDIIIEYHAAH